jgi:hypothetical protein
MHQLTSVLEKSQASGREQTKNSEEQGHMQHCFNVLIENTPAQ